MEQVLQQAGAIPYTMLDGELRILLVTSRDTGRWLIPKGYVDKGLTPADAAVREAYEEAGIKGAVASDLPLGFFTYFKKLKSGEDKPASVQVFLLRVEKQCKKWPEMKQRQCGWFKPEEAASLVKEPGLAMLLLRVDEIAQGWA
ncbi:MAG TPA: NUDIX hydrolase [Dongiaceae bacterium]|nr:NUDIX hydrolase [Dongiaceae bacterium]